MSEKLQNEAKKRSKASEVQLLKAVKNKDQLEILETLALIFAEDAIEYSKKARYIDDEDFEAYEEMQEKKLKNLLNLQRVNADIIRLQDKTKANNDNNEDNVNSDDKENKENKDVYAILKSLPRL